jgi:hypothetical protein
MSQSGVQSAGDRAVIFKYSARKPVKRKSEMAEHEHGSMNTEVHEQTFGGFIKASTYVAAASIAAIVLALLFFG